ncbi:protein bicaudal D-like isoform X2 [Sitophilus oryzae]|uniref:Protein bicaudal D-like isoform X2 n=1 Tax=Sitophilus oryzae TaxID=7048 RepID=A0A6J2Y932_SITOR|nr:protein bicaudal D-like isoform X2 [Sitophilus oryzae]
MNNSLSTEAENSKAEELREQVTRLEGLLLKKRKQIKTLRTALKPHEKTTANLKRKSENAKLRHKLKLLKKDAATFSSLKARFEARCAEYSAQAEGLRLQVGVAKDEKKTTRQYSLI